MPTTGKSAAFPSPRRRNLSEILLRLVECLLGWKRTERLYILLSALRSCRGHVGTALRSGIYCAEFGFVWTQNGILDARSHSRSVGTENLQRTYRWVDTLDIQIFLAGFDAGERFALPRGDTQSNMQ